ncbi:HNH endonuclease [Bacillus seohaeanensis]|uniref:Putative HNH nuclease YajD n=1 Tax=Bacillus seohaeanensis TaxID=284580 RepID=A0ABW5RSF4_9BACI
MPSKPLKECAKVGCYALTKDRYCDKHEIVADDNKRENDKEYNARRDEKYTTFYKSKEWRTVRSIVFKRDLGLCQIHLKEHNQLVSGSIVHHLVELRDGQKGWELRVEPSNLQTVCQACHNKIHSK